MIMVLDTKKSNFERQEWLQFHIWFIIIRTLLQNATDIITNVSSFLLQNATDVTKCKAYYKMR